MRYLEQFRRFPELLDSVIDIPRSARRIKGLLLFRVPMPLPIARSPDVEVDNWFSLRRRLEALKEVSTSDLISNATASSESTQIAQRGIDVGEWTYRFHSIVSIDSSQIAIDDVVRGSVPKEAQR
jgi:hypothetical protein